MTFQQLLKAAGTAVRLIGSGQSDELRHVIRTRWNGLDLDHATLDELGLSSEYAEPHSATRAPALRRVFKAVGVRPGSVLLDFGSGKGGALIALARLPFREMIGVEISPALVAIAQRNVERLHLGNVRFVQSDARDYTDLDQVTHIFMYNPFPCAVMTEVLANLATSLTRAPRRLTLVYRNPVCHGRIIGSGIFDTAKEHRPEPTAWMVYRHDPARWSRPRVAVDSDAAARS